MEPPSEEDFTIPADLGPGEAPQMRDSLLAWLSGDACGVLDISAADPVSPCALQLLAATARSARFAPPRLGPGAASALDALGIMQPGSGR